MNDILNSTEYTELQTAKAALEIERGEFERIKARLVNDLLIYDWDELHAGEDRTQVGNGDVDSFPFWQYVFELQNRDVKRMEEVVSELEAKLFAAFPPPADVTSAIEVATAAKAAKDAAVKAFEDSLTDEQRALRDAVTATETRLDDTVARAKSLILEFGASPSKAFVVRRTDKHEVAGDVRPLLRDVSLGDLPTDLVSLNVKAIVQRAADGLDNRGLTVTTTQTANVAAYLNKL